MDKKPSGGAFIIARQIFESDIFLSKPATWLKLWIYILGHVNHEEKRGFKRGEGFFNCRAISDSFPELTEDVIKKCLRFARSSSMISTTRSTRGIRILVNNYDAYQSLDSYTSTTKSTREAREKHERSTPINKNRRIKELKNNTNTVSIATEVAGKEVNELIALFEPVNPSFQRLYANTTQRGALERLVARYGVEKTRSTIAALPGIIMQKYAPQITTPLQLEEKLGALIAFVAKNREHNLTSV